MILRLLKLLYKSNTDKPRFDNLFIHVGAFHIMMAFFKAVGKFIDECGITNIMVNAEMLANGSVSSFIAGKHFNRCKRLHPIVSLALQTLHFEQFLHVEKVEVPEEMKKDLTDFLNTTSDIPTLQTTELLQLFKKYDDFRQKTLRGEHGKTPQFYMMYSNLIDYYLILNGSIRTGDFESFKFILPKIANIFFTFNQQNYSRYLTITY